MEELYIGRVIAITKRLRKASLELSGAIGVLQSYSVNPLTKEMYEGLVKIISSKEVREIISKENKTAEDIKIKKTYDSIKNRLEEIKPYLDRIELKLEF